MSSPFLQRVSTVSDFVSCSFLYVLFDTILPSASSLHVMFVLSSTPDQFCSLSSFSLQSSSPITTSRYRRSFNILTSFSFLRPSRHDHVQFVSAPVKSLWLSWYLWKRHRCKSMSTFSPDLLLVSSSRKFCRVVVTNFCLVVCSYSHGIRPINLYLFIFSIALRIVMMNCCADWIVVSS